MVGTEVLHQCLDCNQIDGVVTIGRHVTGVAHPKLVEKEHQNFLDFALLEAELSAADVCIYCLGVYQNQVRADLFWEITVDYLSALIDAMEVVNRNLTFCLFSAQGADPTEKSPFRFAKAKGRAEKRLLESSIHRKYVFGLGYIRPGRKSAMAGWSGWIAERFYKLFPVIGIDATALANVMISVGLNGSSTPILSNREMRKLGHSTN